MFPAWSHPHRSSQCDLHVSEVRCLVELVFLVSVLGPINSDAKLQINSKPELLNFISPKIFLSLTLEQLLMSR